MELYDGYFNHGHGDPSDGITTSPEDQNRSVSKDQKVIRGNGDQDDNRAKSYFYCRASFTAIQPPKAIKSYSAFNERRTAIAYKDFGRLKVIPTRTAMLNYRFCLQATHMLFVGGLYFFSFETNSG